MQYCRELKLLMNMHIRRSKVRNKLMSKRNEQFINLLFYQTLSEIRSLTVMSKQY